MARKLFSLSLVCFLVLLAGADWRQFRGGSRGGVAEDSRLPLTWSDDENIAWKADLPGRGPASPIVVGDRVFVTCSDGIRQQRLYVLCFDAESGFELWRREFWATGRTATHPTSAVAAPTPASDGERIFAFYSSNDLVCLDLDGNLQWFRGLAYDYPKAGNDVGMSSSPVVVDGVVVVQIENQGDSFAAGIDTDSGETLWRVDRAKQANWASPVVLTDSEGRHAVLLQSPDRLTAHEPRSGKQLWRLDLNCAGIPSAAPAGGRLYLPSGGITALDVDSATAKPKIAWDENRLNPGSASPVVHDGFVYTLAGGVLKCGAAADGKVLWQLRLQGKYWATPVIAGGRMYCVNQDGAAKVVELGDKGKIIGKAEFGEPVFGTPAVANNAMYVRSDKHLWKVASP